MIDEAVLEFSRRMREFAQAVGVHVDFGGIDEGEADARAAEIAAWFIAHADVSDELESSVVAVVLIPHSELWREYDPHLLGDLAFLATWHRLVGSARGMRRTVPPRAFGWYANVCDALDPQRPPSLYGLDLTRLRTEFVARRMEAKMDPFPIFESPDGTVGHECHASLGHNPPRLSMARSMMG